MKKKIFSTALILVMIGLFTSCDVSKKIRTNQKEISQLKATVRLLKESVANYERQVKQMSYEIETLQKNKKRR